MKIKRFGNINTLMPHLVNPANTALSRPSGQYDPLFQTNERVLYDAGIHLECIACKGYSGKGYAHVHLQIEPMENEYHQYGEEKYFNYLDQLRDAIVPVRQAIHDLKEECHVQHAQ